MKTTGTSTARCRRSASSAGTSRATGLNARRDAQSINLENAAARKWSDFLIAWTLAMSEKCPNYEENEQLKGQPIGMYHCGYCGEMVVAGIDCRPLCQYRPAHQPTEAP